jgi:outer membrane protein assembly factor BamB
MRRPVGVSRIAVIELGEIATEQDIDEPPARPWSQRRWTFTALVVSLALVGLGGSAPSARPLPMVVVDVAANSAVLATPDRVVVVDPGRAVSGRGRGRYVTAYRLMDLERLWRIDLPVDGSAIAPLTSADTIILSRLDYATPPDRHPDARPDTAAVDAASGALLWRLEGSAEAWTSAGHLLMSFDQGGPAGVGEPDYDGQLLRAVSARTGAVVWKVEMPAGAIRTYRTENDRINLLALILPGGQIELRDPNTGELLRTGRTAAPPWSNPEAPSAEIVGDVLLVQERAAVAAYALDGLDLRWRLPVSAVGIRRPYWCGNALCFRHERKGLQRFDARTGRIRWSDRRWTTVLAATEGSLVVGNYDAASDRFHVVTLDPDTAQVRQDLGTWDGLDRNARDEWLIGYQFDLTRALVSRVDPERGARVVAILHDVSRSCRVRVQMLVCRRTDNTVGVWRLPG